MRLNLRHLEMFLAVVEELHFTRAAKRLHVAQPALSRGVRALENEIGVDLLRRDTRKVELTEAGRSFQTNGVAALAQLKNAVASARALGGADRLNIGYMDFAIAGLFPRLLREFRTRFPNIDVQACASHTARIIEELIARSMDVGFVVGPLRHKDLSTITVQRDRFVAVVNDTHPLARKKYVTLTDLTDEPLVMGRRETWAPYLERVDALCRVAGFRPRVVQEADTMEGIFAFVGSGIGSTIYVERASNYNPPGLAVRFLSDVRDCITTEIAWRPRGSNRTVQAFIDIAKELVATEAAMPPHRPR